MVQIGVLKAELAAMQAEMQANAAVVAEAASARSQIDWLHNRLQSSIEEVQVQLLWRDAAHLSLSCAHCSRRRKRRDSSKAHVPEQDAC